ncbi:hypothetical protein [Neorhizobium sp. DAR64872/K0K18]|uniref:hypothetical protein n=1 Tax=Neorhizobium sp. DAR64872/K0K18 TaxID=3421958 RepID=UPI003D2B251A
MTVETLSILVDAVTRRYENNRSPLYLSALGQLLKQDRELVIKQFGSLSKAVDAAGPNKLEMINRSHPGAIVVVTPAVRDEVQSVLESLATSKFDALPAPLQIAFCLRTEAGQSVAVKVSPPMRYLRLESTEPVPAGFIAVDGVYRSPGLDLRTASTKEKEVLWRAFLGWAEKNNIAPDILVRGTQPTNALERLLSLQPPEILDRLNIPADIIAILLKHQ